MADTRRNSESDWSWFIIIGLFVIFWPIGLLTLFAKLFGPDGKSQGQQAPPLQGAASAAQAAARFSKNVVSSAVPPRASRPQQQRQKKGEDTCYFFHNQKLPSETLCFIWRWP